MDIKLTKKELFEFLKKPTPKNGWVKNTSIGQFSILREQQDKIYEGLIKTYPIDSIERKIKRDFPELRYEIVETAFKSKSLLVYPINKTIADNIIHIMDTYGWFLSFPKTLDRNNFKNLKFEAKYDIQVDFDYNKPLILSHLTPSVNLKNILKNGLSPKTNSKLSRHPDRVYFFTKDLPFDKLFTLASKLYIENKNIPKYKYEYTLLNVEFNDEPTPPDGFHVTAPRIKLFADPNAPGCVYTMENVNPKNITIIATFEFDDNGNIIEVK